MGRTARKGVNAEHQLGTIEGKAFDPEPEEFAEQKVNQMLPDDYTSDPDPAASGVPGTTDDVPASYGEDPPSVGGPPQGELWRRQRALIEEDEKTGLRLEGFPVEEIPEILDAMGDDAVDPLDDSPNGTSATGLWGTPDHGGFPPRTD
jgi:hypothetical protein